MRRVNTEKRGRRKGEKRIGTETQKKKGAKEETNKESIPVHYV
jgi:hypothetical protein